MGGGEDGVREGGGAVFVLFCFFLVRLHTGHNRLNIPQAEDGTLSCPCGREDETTERVLQGWALHEALREDNYVVRERSHDNAKLNGCGQELEKTISLVS